MNERGQVFTLDMFFALALTALIVSYSGLALEQARRQAESYALRYSLERTANDAADVLVKTAGDPQNWSQNFETLETLGLAENDSAGNPIPNSLSVGKFENLRQLCASANWDANPDAAQAVRALFGDSENFEIRLIDENTGENLWPPIYPRWDVKATSGVENSLEVVIVKRLISTQVEVENKIENIRHIKQPELLQMYFTVGTNELNTRDWYIVVKRYLAPLSQPVVWITVNRDMDTGNPDWKFPPDDPPFKMWWHGNPQDPPSNDLQEGQNYIWVRVAGRGKSKGNPVDVSIVSMPFCSSSRFVELPPVATLEVRVWR